MSKRNIEITLYATVEEDFDPIRFWDDIQSDGTSQFMRVYNPGYRELSPPKEPHE